MAACRVQPAPSLPKKDWVASVSKEGPGPMMGFVDTAIVAAPLTVNVVGLPTPMIPVLSYVDGRLRPPEGGGGFPDRKEI